MLVDAAARVVVGIIYHLPPMSFTYNMAAAPSINVYDSSSLWRPTKGCSSLPIIDGRLKKPGKMGIPKGVLVFSAGPESPTITVTESTQAAPSEAESEAAAPAAEKPKPKRPAAAKTPAKPLPHLMEEDVIPALRAILEAQQDLSQIQLSFQDNRLEGSFEKSGIPYYFWAFFPNGVLTGPKGFALSSHGSEASTVEPFLIDEKKITAKHVVFWVEKRLAAQGIIPVWQE